MCGWSCADGQEGEGRASCMRRSRRWRARSSFQEERFAELDAKIQETITKYPRAVGMVDRLVNSLTGEFRVDARIGPSPCMA